MGTKLIDGMGIDKGNIMWPVLTFVSNIIRVVTIEYLMKKKLSTHATRFT